MNTVEAPKCRRCKKPCQLYEGIGGYSVQCRECNEEKARKSRERSAKKREEKILQSQVDRIPIPRIFTDYMTVDQVKAALSDSMLFGTDLTNIRRVTRAGGLIAVELE